jgi:hypothetical protein
VTTPYKSENGRIRAVVPFYCPDAGDGPPCHVQIHHYRRRKTGIPWGSLAVAKCRTHGLTFTLYPPGYVPYGREPYVELGPDGSALARDPGDSESALSPGYFAAAHDAAEGVLWPLDSAPTPPDAVRSTQRRRVLRLSTLLGLASGASPAPAVVADVTGLPAGILLEIASELASVHDLTRRGRQARDVLRRLAGDVGRALMDRLAVLGHLAGRWGHPYRWRTSIASLIELGRPFWHPNPPGTEVCLDPVTRGEGIHDFGHSRPP